MILTEEQLVEKAKKILSDLKFRVYEFLGHKVSYQDEDTMLTNNTPNPVWTVGFDDLGPLDSPIKVFVSFDSITGKPAGPVVFKGGLAYLDYDEATDTYIKISRDEYLANLKK